MKKPTTPKNLRSTASSRAVTAVALVDTVSADAPASRSGRRKSLRRQHDRTQRRFLACERRQLAQQIHDDLGGVLTALMGTIAVAIESDIVAKRAPNTLMLDARTLASAAFASVSKIGTNLRPTLLEEMGLLAGIEWQVRSLGLRRGMCTSFYFDARLELADLPDECERVVFRVVSEAINNTEKHAKASTLRVRIYRCAQLHVSCVEDDGIGLVSAPPRRAGSLGLLGMKEQAAAIGGSLELGTAVGGGLKICLRIPLDYCDEQ